jgi:hypothetical protein
MIGRSTDRDYFDRGTELDDLPLPVSGSPKAAFDGVGRPGNPKRRVTTPSEKLRLTSANGRKGADSAVAVARVECGLLDR